MQRAKTNFIPRGSAVVAAIAVLCMATVAVATKIEHEEKRTIKADGKTTIIIKNARGKTVVIGWSGDEIRVLATKRVKARDEKRATHLMEQLEWVVKESDRTVTIETRQSRQTGEGRSLWSMFKNGKEFASIDYAIEVPEAFAVRATTTVGEIRVSNCGGGAKAAATSGTIFFNGISGNSVVELTSGTIKAEDIDGDLRIDASSATMHVRRVSGRLIVRATSGDIDVVRVGGDTDIHLASGDLRLDSCLGDLVFRTSTGDAAISGVEGSISAVTSSGDLEVMILPVGDRDFRLSSSSGNIGVSYRPGHDNGFHLDIITSSGSIEGDMPIRLEEITRRRLRGVVGTGKSRVVIETASGDVRVFEKKAEKKARKK